MGKKLTIEHLAPYLPYGLKWDLQGLKQFKMIGLTPETLYTQEGTVLTWPKHPELPIALKPILRPLSDLHNNDLHWKEAANNECSCNNDEHMIYKDFTKNKFISHVFWQWLVANLFDVFGLIEQGLAIDINTLPH